MTGQCAICGVLVEAPEDNVLDAGRAALNFGKLAAAIGGHVQKHHADLAQTLAPLFIEFQLWMFSYFLVDPVTAAPWQAERAAAHARLRAVLAEDRPIEIKRVSGSTKNGTCAPQ